MKTNFFTFEGIDGSSKTTQVQMLSDWMKERDIPHIITKEPGNTHIEECMKIRELLLDPTYNLTPNAELLLFLADRAQHVEKVIKVALNEGKNVICDRYADSTRVYQSARNLSRSKIDMLIDFATSGLKPDLTFILDMPVECGLERAKAKSIYKDGDRMEKEDMKFHNDVRCGFLKLTENIVEQYRFRVINVAPPRTKEEIHEDIIQHVAKKLWIGEME